MAAEQSDYGEEIESQRHGLNAIETKLRLQLKDAKELSRPLSGLLEDYLVSTHTFFELAQTVSQELEDAQAMMEINVIHNSTVENGLSVENELLTGESEKFAFIVNSSEELMLLVNKDGILEAVNEAFCQFVQKDREAVLGQSLSKVSGTPFSESLLGMTSQVFRGETAQSEFSVASSNTAKPIWFDCRAYAYSGKGAKVTHAVFVCGDVTQRKLDESRIVEQAALLDKARDAIQVCDLSGKFSYWNKSSEELYGWTAEEALGEPISILFGGEDSDYINDAVSSVLKSGQWQGDMEQTIREDKQILVESRWTLVRDDEGTPQSFLIINTDITERRALENQVIRAQRMQSIGSLAGGIAHDLNNILAPFFMSLRALEPKLAGDDQSLRIIEILEASAKRGADLVKQILTFSRGVEGEKIRLKLKFLLSEIEAFVMETFPKDIQLLLDIPRDLWFIHGDTSQIHQIFLNLCVNARDAMPDGGMIRIEAKNEDIKEDGRRPGGLLGPHIRVIVTDEGEGIPKAIQDKVFDPYFTTKDVGKGTGIGLSTVMAVVRNHQGVVELESVPGKGTKFHLYFPAVPDAVEEIDEHQNKIHHLPGNGEVIMVVDDEQSIRNITKTTLDNFGYKTIVFENGQEALSFYKDNSDRINLVIMDMMMPVMDGPTAIEEMKKVNVNVQVIGVTGIILGEDKSGRFKNVKDEVQAFLFKPYTTELLLKSIDDVLKATVK
ncbi:PAS domain S-box protein [bacterium]|jgi:two-component system, cell cycle sensor histidine kinase and response regulator CckA|nr:PAS domain S-box protein [bacterium]